MGVLDGTVSESYRYRRFQGCERKRESPIGSRARGVCFLSGRTRRPGCARVNACLNAVQRSAIIFRQFSVHRIGPTIHDDYETMRSKLPFDSR
ncbi:hypothetical protein IG631_16157 [Alternaria alternata]|nr:hypothetical protein IG631_16157 [Alternaria alternata]